ncbi:unnamed protein product [Chrysoparadoxa australica]
MRVGIILLGALLQSFATTEESRGFAVQLDGSSTGEPNVLLQQCLHGDSSYIHASVEFKVFEPPHAGEGEVIRAATDGEIHPFGAPLKLQAQLVLWDPPGASLQALNDLLEAERVFMCYMVDLEQDDVFCASYGQAVLVSQQTEGPHSVHAWPADENGAALDCSRPADYYHYTIAPVADNDKGGEQTQKPNTLCSLCKSGPVVLSPQQGTSTMLLAELDAKGSLLYSFEVTIDILPLLDTSAEIAREQRDDLTLHIQLEVEGPSTTQESVSLSPSQHAGELPPIRVRAPTPGLTTITAWVTRHEMQQGCMARVQVYTTCSQGTLERRHGKKERTDEDLVVVTAGNAPYFSRVANLIGSVHYWEPSVPVIFYGIDLTDDMITEASSWSNVQLRTLPLDELPSHFSDPKRVGYKPWMILQALSQHLNVLWLDANAELRRPLSTIRELIARDGYFFTSSGRSWPSGVNVRQATLSHFGCNMEPHAQMECTTAFLGFAAGSSAVKEVLEPFHLGCSNETVLWPPDATFNNQRRDQSVFNALLCQLDWKATCHSDKRYWGYEGMPGLQPHPLPESFNDLVLFSRRDMQPKPYMKHIRLKGHEY